MTNSDLLVAARGKKDEFYTQLTDIEKEMKHYKASFRGKSIFCNCDDPYESNFFKYFALNFNSLGLEKLTTTSFAGSPFAEGQLPLFDLDDAGQKEARVPYKVVITEVPDLNHDGAVDLTDVELLVKSGKNVLTRLEGDGDFRSEESMRLLKEADIVVTNPPFSLIGEFIDRLVRNEKKFVILGDINHASYNSIFPLIRNQKVWWGPSISSGDRVFEVPSYYPLNASGCWEDPDGRRFIRKKGVRWYTNLDHPRRHEEVALHKKYTPDEYPKFEFYDAINVNEVKLIPVDYFEPMGVPITFLDKYNPEQFEILDANSISTGAPSKAHGLIKDKHAAVQGVRKFVRIPIRRK